jgi:hypothetical protein
VQEDELGRDVGEPPVEAIAAVYGAELENGDGFGWGGVGLVSRW